MPPKKLNQPKCAGHRERTPTKQGVSSLTPLIKLPKEPLKITAIVKRLGFCGVYAQGVFHAIEPNQCYTQAIY